MHATFQKKKSATLTYIPFHTLTRIIQVLLLRAHPACERALLRAQGLRGALPERRERRRLAPRRPPMEQDQKRHQGPGGELERRSSQPIGARRSISISGGQRGLVLDRQLAAGGLGLGAGGDRVHRHGPGSAGLGAGHRGCNAGEWYIDLK